MQQRIGLVDNEDVLGDDKAGLKSEEDGFAESPRNEVCDENWSTDEYIEDKAFTEWIKYWTKQV